MKVDAGPTCATHFHPSIQLDSQGRLWVAWDENPRGAGRVAWAVSQDGAATFTPAQALSGAPFAFTTSRDMPGWLGDGLQLLVSGNRLLAAWSDPSDPAGNAPTWLDPVHVHVRTASLPP